jgi:hypothetical protein
LFNKNRGIFPLKIAKLVEFTLLNNKISHFFLERRKKFSKQKTLVMILYRGKNKEGKSFKRKFPDYKKKKKPNKITSAPRITSSSTH